MNQTTVEKELKTNPYNGRALLNLALCYVLIGQIDRARQEFDKILSVNPQDQTVLDLLSCLGADDQWEIVKIPHFIIVYSRALEHAGYARLVVLLEDILPKLQLRLKRNLTSDVMIAVDPKFAPLSRVEIFNRPLSPKICLAQEHIRADILIHELTHVLAFNYNRFLTEGLAVAMQYALADTIQWPFPGQSIPDVLQKNLAGLISPADLLAERSDHLRFFAIEKVDELEGKLAYLESGALVAFILKRWGIEKFDLLFTYLDNPSNYVHPRGAIEGVERVLGLSFAEFERQWKEEYRVAEPAKNFAIRPPVAGDAGQEIGGAVDMLASGEQTYDFAALGALRQYFAVAMVQCPQNAQLQYYLARALFGLVNTPQGRDDPEFSRRCLEEAQKHTENFLVVEPQFSDAHRLLGEIFSSLIRFKGKMSVLKYGPRAEACLTKAVELDPQNPNAWLGLGRVKLFTPPLFGGGVEVAQKHFAKARELSPLRSDIIAWQGMAHYEARGIERAKKCFLFSLSLNPRDLLAQEMLTEINKEVCNAQ